MWTGNLTIGSESDAARQAVSFDCDSTLATIEGIDELAAQKGLKEAVEALTKKAME